MILKTGNPYACSTRLIVANGAEVENVLDQARTRIEAFAYNYSALLNALHNTFNGAANQDDEVITPSKNILKGITRKRILALSDFKCNEGAISLTDIEQAKEAIIASTTRIVLPVLKVDGKIIGSGKPGTITTSIYQKLLGQHL